MIDTKLCSRCHQDKSLSEFYRSSSHKGGLHTYCKTCMKEYAKHNEARIKQLKKDWCRRNAEHIKQYKKEHPVHINRWRHGFKNLSQTTGIPVDALIAFYVDAYDKQGGKCAICGVHEDNLDKRLSVDHDHVTLRLRGLLCQRCNLGVGFLDDSVKCSKASQYLK